MRQPCAKKFKASFYLNPLIPLASQGERKAPAGSCDSHPCPATVSGRAGEWGWGWGAEGEGKLEQRGLGPRVLAESTAGLERKAEFPNSGQGLLSVQASFLTKQPLSLSLKIYPSLAPHPGPCKVRLLSISGDRRCVCAELRTEELEHPWGQPGRAASFL